MVNMYEQAYIMFWMSVRLVVFPLYFVLMCSRWIERPLEIWTAVAAAELSSDVSRLLFQKVGVESFHMLSITLSIPVASILRNDMVVGLRSLNVFITFPSNLQS